MLTQVDDYSKSILVISIWPCLELNALYALFHLISVAQFYKVHAIFISNLHMGKLRLKRG